MKPLTKLWYGAAEKYQPKPSVDYGWVWDYARFRFEWAYGNGRYIEEKAITLFKFLLAITAGFGTAISFFVAQRVLLSPWSYVFGIAAVVALALSAVSLLLTFDPSTHLYPIEEEAALICVDRHDQKQDCRANMALALTASTEFERQSINKQAWWLRLGLGFACLAIVLFILSLFCEVGH